MLLLVSLLALGVGRESAGWFVGLERLRGVSRRKQQYAWHRDISGAGRCARRRPGELDRAEALGGKILELCVKVGGSITGEHGVGREKINQMCAQFNSDELTLFHAVKAAFDPGGLLNPGKNIPTLHRCAEFGAMHVHMGQLPFPELERF